MQLPLRFPGRPAPGPPHRSPQPTLAKLQDCTQSLQSQSPPPKESTCTPPPKKNNPHPFKALPCKDRLKKPLDPKGRPLLESRAWEGGSISPAQPQRVEIDYSQIWGFHHHHHHHTSIYPYGALISQLLNLAMLFLVGLWSQAWSNPAHSLNLAHGIDCLCTGRFY